MKKSIIALLIGCFTASVSFGQHFMKETNVISAGIGLGSSLGGFNYGSQTPALSVSYERGVWEVGGPGVISLGGYAGVKRYQFKGEGYKEKWGYTIIGVRGAYHYNGLNVENLDLYGGVMLSYNLLKYSYKDDDGNHISSAGNYGSAAGFTLFAGGRYYFSPNIAAFAELGYGVSYLTLGLAFSF